MLSSPTQKPAAPCMSWQTKGTTGSYEFEEMTTTVATKHQAALEAATDKENRLRVRRKEYHGHRVKQHRSVPRQRVGALTKILQYRHGGACTTDDGETYFDLVAPFLVEASRIEGGVPVAYVTRWAKLNVPDFVEAIGQAGIDARVSAMVRQMDDTRQTRTRWTPGMPTIVSALQLTLEEVRAIGLRGFGSINPPSISDKKASQRERMTKLRRSRGMKPQEDRTRTKCDKALAAAIGRTLRTIQLWRKAGRLEEMVRQYAETGIIDFAKLCSPSSGEYGAHTSAKFAAATNDNARLERSA